MEVPSIKQVTSVSLHQPIYQPGLNTTFHAHRGVAPPWRHTCGDVPGAGAFRSWTASNFGLNELRSFLCLCSLNANGKRGLLPWPGGVDQWETSTTPAATRANDA